MNKIKVYPKHELPLRSNVPGAKMWAVGLEKAMLTYFEMEPNTKFPEHSHEAEQITMVLDGELTFAYEEKEITLKSGDVISIPSNAVHSAFTGSKPCKGSGCMVSRKRGLQRALIIILSCSFRPISSCP